MKELIKISEMEGRQVVSARELHNFLEASERFQSWFDRQIQYGFKEGTDYVGCKIFNALAKRQLQDYALTVDMAKEVSMLQKSDKGKKARQYFIEMEKKAKQPLSQIDIIIQSAQLLKANAKKLEQHDDRLDRLEAKQTTRREDLFTVAGWGTLKGIQVNMKMASSLGRKASKLCRDRGIDVDSIPDPRFGRVNVYPEEVLEEVFQMPLTG